jgi:hypothetical protein
MYSSVQESNKCLLWTSCALNFAVFAATNERQDSHGPFVHKLTVHEYIYIAKEKLDQIHFTN